jgi:hypothetical protein
VIAALFFAANCYGSPTTLPPREYPTAPAEFPINYRSRASVSRWCKLTIACGCAYPPGTLHPTNGYIIVLEGMPEWRTRYVIWHEYAHLLGWPPSHPGARIVRR